MASEKNKNVTICRVVGISLPILCLVLFGLWKLQTNDTIGFEDIEVTNITETSKRVKTKKIEKFDYEVFNRKWHSYNVSESTVDYFVSQGINVIYASMAASASYDFIIDVSPPQVHFERKSFLKSDKIDFTFGKWTYYTIPFGGFKNGFKTKVRAKNGRLIEKIINLDDPEGPVEYKRYQIVSSNGVDYLRIDLQWGDEVAQFYLK